MCCPACGPSLRLLDRDRSPIAGDPLIGAVQLLRAGGVLAVKGVGGYHLAALAGSRARRHRPASRKHREDKPFAVMVADLDGARALGRIGAAEARALTSPRRPIVLLRRAAGARWPRRWLPEIARSG